MTEQALTVQSQISGVPTAPQGRYVSIFEDPETFVKKMQIAEALSRTQFVPEAFRGRAEDCLVALDMAARLELNPLAVFPDLYVIDNRASFSSKFLIALVNRSGRFTRIEYEEGIDGEADVTVTDWGANKGEKKKTRAKLPNYYATASFTELTTGRSFSSPRIDVRFAEKNGWVEKLGSKWRSMPELMVRYRSAAILIRTTCPELVMGLEWAEDLLDQRSDAGPQYAGGRPIEIEAVHAAGSSGRSLAAVPVQRPKANVTDFKTRLRQAKSEDELRGIAKEIADAEVSDYERVDLREEYARKKREFSTDSGRKPDANQRASGAGVSKTPGEEVLSELALMNAIRNATNADALQRVRESIEFAIEEGRIESDVASRLFDAIDQRADELSEEPESATDQQKSYARNLADAIREAATKGDAELLDKQIANATSWRDSGYITEKQRDDLIALAEAKKKELSLANK